MINNTHKARKKELIVKALLSNPKLISAFAYEKRWLELLWLTEFVEKDAPKSLIGTDNALYRTLRTQITEFQLTWQFNKKQLKRLAEATPTPSKTLLPQ